MLGPKGLYINLCIKLLYFENTKILYHYIFQKFNYLTASVKHNEIVRRKLSSCDATFLNIIYKVKILLLIQVIIRNYIH